MAISNMQQARQLRAGGGIMDLEPRQGFFLGKIAKKITKPLKKVFKSPLGKAALLAGGTYMLGGGRFGLGSGPGFDTKTLGNTLSRIAFGKSGGKGFAGQGLFGTGGDFSGQRALLTGGIGASLLPFMLGGGDDEEEEVTESFSVTPGSITDIVSMAKARDPSLRFLPQNAYTQQGFFGAADGGIADLSKPKRGLVDEPGGYAGLNLDSKAKKHLRMVYKQKGANPDGLSFNEWVPLNFEMALGFKDGGMARTGYAMGGPTEDVMVENVDTQEVVSNPDPMAELNMLAIELFGKRLDQLNETERGQLQELIQSRMQQQDQQRVMAESGGMIDYMSSANPMADSYIMEDTDIVNMYRPSGDRQMAAEGGIMDLGGMEKDYREEGGFVPIGGEEKADDVPARLSKNEFVFTADAVRNAGGGDIDRGAEVMENLMNNLEQGGEVSEESQGMNPAQEMFDTAQMLESRIA
jgi:hypothetical protein